MLNLEIRNSVSDAKRMIGKDFDDSVVQKDSKVWPFKIVNAKGKLKIEVVYKEETRQFLPEQISAMVLSKMKESCEAFLKYKVTDAVITVPAYFNDSQRQATKDAGTIAGLNVLRIINEPTAAALAFGFQEKFNTEKKVLIYDLGGGTFDISILSIDKCIFNVIALAGDTHLGGQDFDLRMAKHLADEFQKKNKKTCWENKRARIKLLAYCEKAKHVLSTSMEATIYIESLFEGIDFQMKMTRACFNKLNADLFTKTMELLKKALIDSQLNKDDIEEIVLIGGSTRIPKVRELIKEFFNCNALNEKVNADEAVAYGAAIQASILNGNHSILSQNLQLHDAIPQSLGIKTRKQNPKQENIMTIVIAKNSTIPIKITKTFFTSYDNQTVVKFQVFEGEDYCTLYNHWLGEFSIDGIPPRRKGDEEFDCTFDIDENGILSVYSVNRSTGRKGNVIINKKRLDVEEMKAAIKQFGRFRIEDERNNEAITAKNNLETLCHKIQLTVDELKNKIHQTEKDKIQKECQIVLEWIDENPAAATAINEYVSRERSLEELSKKIFKSDVSILFIHEDIPD